MYLASCMLISAIVGIIGGYFLRFINENHKE
jgi:hypothetical protein